MEQRPRHQSASSKFNLNPTNIIVGSIDAAHDALDALRDSTAAFTATKVELLTDEEGARRIGGSEAMVHVFDPTQKVPAFCDASVTGRRVEKELRASHYLIGVVAKDEYSRQRARNLSKSHDSHFINFYGRFAAESSEP